MAEEEWQVCAVCAWPLLRWRDKRTGEVQWQHGIGREDDHLPVPVNFSEVHTNQRCDFCDTTEDVDTVIMSRNFVMPTAMLGGPDQGSSGHWAACATCGRLVERKAWGQLVTRVKQVGGPGARQAPRKYLVALYERLGQNMYGVIGMTEWRARPATPLDQLVTDYLDE